MLLRHDHLQKNRFHTLMMKLCRLRLVSAPYIWYVYKTRLSLLVKETQFVLAVKKEKHLH